MKHPQPNILFIMADDHASKAISAYGAGINATPNIDRIAKEGVRLDHCYVTNSICTPSRAAILTGTYNHVNGVTTLETHLDNRLPNVAKHLQEGGYQTAIVGKWHLGEGEAHQPTGFDYWSVLPGQGDYFDPAMIEMGEDIQAKGYVTDVITDKSLDWLDNRKPDQPFFLMCHHKAPHREWEPHPNTRHLYTEPIPVPETFDDDYRNRATAAAEAKMRIKQDMTYSDLGLVQPVGGDEIGERSTSTSTRRKIPSGHQFASLRLIDEDTGEVFTFNTEGELDRFKYQRYLQRYLRTIASIDERFPSFVVRDIVPNPVSLVYLRFFQNVADVSVYEFQSLIDHARFEVFCAHLVQDVFDDDRVSRFRRCHFFASRSFLFDVHRYSLSLTLLFEDAWSCCARSALKK